MNRALFCLALLLAGCRDHRPPAPTPQQSSELNDAEDMLNGMSENEMVENQEGPEANASGPSNSVD